MKFFKHPQTNRKYILIVVISVLFVIGGTFGYQWWRVQGDLERKIVENKGLIEQINRLQKDISQLTEERGVLGDKISELNNKIKQLNLIIDINNRSGNDCISTILSARSLPKNNSGFYGIEFSWYPPTPRGSTIMIWGNGKCGSSKKYAPGELVYSWTADNKTEYSYYSANIFPGSQLCGQIWKDFYGGLIASNPVTVTIEP